MCIGSFLQKNRAGGTLGWSDILKFFVEGGAWQEVKPRYLPMQLIATLRAATNCAPSTAKSVGEVSGGRRPKHRPTAAPVPSVLWWSSPQGETITTHFRTNLFSSHMLCQHMEHVGWEHPWPSCWSWVLVGVVGVTDLGKRDILKKKVKKVIRGKK